MKPSEDAGQKNLRILIANPSADEYGSDLQLLESVAALVQKGHIVKVLSPDDGPLIRMLEERGASTGRLKYPVVRRRNASPLGMIELIWSAGMALPRISKAIRSFEPDLVYVNTLTIPWWEFVARVRKVPVVVHVHEAEADDPKPVRLGLNAPLKFADRVIVNSATTLETMTEVIPSLAARAVRIHNGVQGPPSTPSPVKLDGKKFRVAVVGRLSPRKATDIALRAVAELRAEGRDISIDVAGTAFEGYEWYVEELHQQARSDDLDGAVDFLGYVNPIWNVLAGADAVLAPSTRESLGNAVIEAQLAERPVIASATSGHFESVENGATGLMFPVNDVASLKSAIEKLIDDPEFAAQLAAAGRASAEEKFSLERYRTEIVEVVECLVRGATRR